MIYRKKIIIFSAIILTAVIIFIFIGIGKKETIKLSDVDKLKKYNRTLPKYLSIFLDLNNYKLNGPYGGYTCDESSCSYSNSNDGLALNLWAAYALSGVERLLLSDQNLIEFFQGSKSLLVKKLASEQLKIALQKFEGVPPSASSDRQLPNFFSQLYDYNQTGSDEAQSKILARLRIWSAAQAIADSASFQDIAPLNEYSYPSNGMVIAVYARNIALINRWIKNGDFLRDHQLGGFSSTEERLMLLSRAKRKNWPDYLTAFKQEIESVTEDTFNYLNQSEEYHKNFTFEKAVLEKVGIGKNYCWNALAKYEHGIDRAEYVLSSLVSNEGKQAFDIGYFTTFDIDPCLQLATKTCTENGKYCDMLDVIINQFILPRIATDNRGLGGFYNSSLENPRRKNSVSYSTSAQLLFSLSNKGTSARLLSKLEEVSN